MTLLRTTRRFAGAVLAFASTAACWAAVTPDDCHVLRKHGHETEAIHCYESLGRSNSAYLRAEGYWGLQQYDQANEQFRIAIAQPDATAMFSRFVRRCAFPRRMPTGSSPRSTKS